MHHHHSETHNCKTSILTKLIIEKYVVTKCNPFISDLCEIAFSNPLSYSWCPGRNQSISFLDSSFLWMHDEQCVCRSSGRCYCASSSSYPKELQKIALGTQGSSRKRILAKSSPPSSFFFFLWEIKWFLVILKEKWSETNSEAVARRLPVDFLHKHDILQIKEKSGKATTANLNRRIWLKIKKKSKMEGQNKIK